MERTGIIEIKGRDATVPEFRAQTYDWATVQALELTQGNGRVSGSLPSFSTEVCERETRKCNEEAASLAEVLPTVHEALAG